MIWERLRYAVGTLWRSSGFAVVAICTLAVGIGANTAMFTVIDGVLLKPLRYRDIDRIVRVNTFWLNSGKTNQALTGGDMLDLRADKNTFQAFSPFIGGEMGLQLGDHAEFVRTYFTFPEFFRVFELTPLAGRTFVEGDGERAAVVAQGFAQRNYGSAQAAVGKTIRFDGKPFQIAGVVPASFNFPEQTQVWLAMSPDPSNLTLARSAYNYRSVAKLQPGVSVDSANSRLETIGSRLRSAYPATNKNKSFRAVAVRDQMVSPVRATLYILWGAVGLLLLIACANVANLMLARNTGRSRDLAVRTALGAGRRHLVAQLFTESMVLAIAASLLGLVLAQWGTQALLGAGSSYVPLPRLTDVHVDWRVLAFALLASIATSVFFGVGPALQASRVNPHDALKQGGSRGSVGGGASRTRNTLVVAQIALSFTLAIGAGLLFRSFIALAETDLGIRTEGLLVMYGHAPSKGKNTSTFAASDLGPARQFDQLYDRLRQLPGVVSVAGVMGLPTGQYGSYGGYAIQGRTTMNSQGLPIAVFSASSPNYFSTVGIPLLRGRDFNTGDQYGTDPVVIVSQGVVKQSFPDIDPIGQRIQCGLDNDSMKSWMTVVGVVGDVRQDSPSDPPSPALYMPLDQHPFRADEQEVVIRSSVSPASLIPAVRAATTAVNPEIATKFTTMDALVSQSIATPRFRTLLAIVFATLAIVLAMSGMYGVMSYVTAQRTSEFGVRMALGARPGDVLRLVLTRALKLVLIGVAAGLLLALASGKLVSAMLFGLKSTDVTTYAAVLLLLLPLVMLMAALPALRAARVDPMVALRDE
jgi:putative ABC transport system permease protein